MYYQLVRKTHQAKNDEQNILCSMNKLSLVIAFCCTAGLLSACTSNHPNSDLQARAQLQAQNEAQEEKIQELNAHPQHLNQEQALNAFKVNQALEHNLFNDYELVKTISSQISDANIYDPSMQAQNKKEKCLLPFIVGGEGKALYWDGQCKKGKAIGLGRAIITQDNKKILELLLEVDQKHPNTLKTYLTYNINTTESELGQSELSLENGLLKGYSATMGYNYDDWMHALSLILSTSNDEGALSLDSDEIIEPTNLALQDNNNATYKSNLASTNDIEFNLTFRYEDTSNLLSFTRIIDLLQDKSSSIIAYPNYSLDLQNLKAQNNSPILKTFRMLEGRQMVGYSYIWLKDGTIIMRDNNTGIESILDEEIDEITQYIADIEAKVALKSILAEDKFNVGISKVEAYAKNKCSTKKALFKDDKVNYICDYIINLVDIYDNFKQAKHPYQQQQAEDNKQLEHRLELFSKQISTLKASK